MIVAALLICLAPTAVDGDTIRCGGAPRRDIRLFGIESTDGSPEDAANRAMLNEKIAGGVVCELTGNSYYRTVARCYNAVNVDVGWQMLAERRVKEWCAYSRNFYGTCAR